MAYTKTTWVDHVTTRPNTYNEVVNQDGTKTLTPAGETQQEGTPVNAQNLNKIEDELLYLDVMTGKICADIASVETSPATAIHAANSYIIYNGSMYKVVNAIGIGDTLTVGSNIEAATVMDAIVALTSNKVDKENGKGLSSNDYTTNEKEKLAGLKNYTGGTGVTIDNDGTINCTATVTVDTELSKTSNNPLANSTTTLTFLAILGLETPVQSGTLTYNGSSQSPTWTGYDNTKLTLSGTTSGTNAGTYTAKFTPKAPYVWADNLGSEERSVNWTINKATVTLPTQSGTLTYNGNSQSPSWNSNYDSSKMTLGGTTSGTNAGDYTATFTPKANYMWVDTTTAAKNATWSIGRAAGTLTLSKSSVTTLKNASTTVTLTTNSDGTKSAESNATGKVTASVSGTTVTLTGGSTSGSATVTVSIAQSTNYTAVSKTISVNNIVASSTLSSNTPDVIKAVAQAGQASNLWSVGDKTSGISISGTVGSLSINGTYYAFILGFNHNSSREGSNSIHFALGMTSGGTRIAFCDSKYNSQASGAYFNMNTSNTNSGGWSSSYMRSTILPAFKNAIASAWRNVMASVTKYSDNTGGGSDTASYVTSTTDTLFLLAEFEVLGARTYANSKEKDYQQQYTYFANGNGKVFYKHDATSTACLWWLRSVSSSGSGYFCIVSTDGSAYYCSAYISLGVVLGFVIK